MTRPKQQPAGATIATAEKRTPLAWIPVFLARLAETGIVREAARTAGIALPTTYDARERHPDFARAWDKALAEGKARGGRAAELCVWSVPEEPQKPATAHWRTRFFEALAETSNVNASAARVNVAPRVVYRLRREDREFATQWLDALHEGYDNLEMEVLGYLRNSGSGRKVDVAAALRLLAAHRETVERRRALTEEEDEQATVEALDAFFEGLRQRRLANEAILREAAHDDGER